MVSRRLLVLADQAEARRAREALAAVPPIFPRLPGKVALDVTVRERVDGDRRLRVFHIVTDDPDASEAMELARDLHALDDRSPGYRTVTLVTPSSMRVTL